MLKSALMDGLWTRNAATVQLLGLCPLLAVSFNVRNALGLAAASSFVLIGSSIAVASIRRYIPTSIRLPCFVLIIATLTTIATMYMQAYAFELYVQVALFVQIIVTNCMILGHIETVASKRPIGESMVSAIGTALGFSCVLIALGTIRQLLGSVIPLVEQPVGAFLVVGSVLAGMNCVVDNLANRRSGEEPT